MAGYSLVQFPSRWLAHRFDEPIIITGGVLLFTLATLSAFAAPSFALLIVTAVFIGIGTGVHKTVAIPFLSRAYPEQTGFSLAIMDTIGQIGGMVAPILVVAILSIVFRWRVIFLLGAVASVSLGIVFHVVTAPYRMKLDGAQPIGSDSSMGEDESPSYVAVFRDRHLILFLLVTMLFTFSWNGLTAFFPLFLTVYKGYSPDSAGLLYSLLFIASVSQTATGLASDRFYRLNISVFLFGCIIAGLIRLLLVDSLLSTVLVTLLVGIGFHGFRPVRDSYLLDILLSGVDGGALGIVRTGMTMIGAISPAIIGFLSDFTGFPTAFGLLVSTLTAGAILLVVLR